MTTDPPTQQLVSEAVQLLGSMVRIPSVSRGESAVADMLCSYLAARGCDVMRFANNLAVLAPAYDPSLPTVMLNSHIDTVKPSPDYSFDPYSGTICDGRVIGLGSNDAGASVVSLTAAFLHQRESTTDFNLILCLSAEEEVGGDNGMRLLLPSLEKKGINIDMAIVGEPTGMQSAVAERGLVVLDCLTRGIAGHAARDEGVNAIYNAIDDMTAIRSFRFPHTSGLLGEIKVSVTMIEAGRQHNVVPDECRWVVDVRTTDAYSNEETARMLSSALSRWTTAAPRSTRVRASVIDRKHPLVRCAETLGGTPFVSSTTSDMSLMHDIPSLKIGPGDSARSHRADEFVLVTEISEAIDYYISFLRQFSTFLK